MSLKRKNSKSLENHKKRPRVLSSDEEQDCSLVLINEETSSVATVSLSTDDEPDCSLVSVNEEPTSVSAVSLSTDESGKNIEESKEGSNEITLKKKKSSRDLKGLLYRPPFFDKIIINEVRKSYTLD